MIGIQRVIARKRVGGGGCLTESLDTDFGAGASTASLGTNAAIQSFQCSAGKISSIAVEYSFIGSAGESVIRWGTDKDLTTYIGEVTETISATGWHIYTFTTKGDVSAATTYYFGVIENSGDIRVLRDLAEGYADGTAYGASGWVGSTAQTYDFNFRIYLCD